MIFQILASLFISIVTANFDEIEDIRANSSGAHMRMKAIRECPVLVSSTLPFDYKETFNKTLTLNLAFNFYYFISIDDLQQSFSTVASLDFTYTLDNCGFENGSEIYFTLQDTNQWVPRIYHGVSNEKFDLAKE